MSERDDDEKADATLGYWLARVEASDQAALNRLLNSLGIIIRRRARKYLLARSVLRPAYGSDDLAQLTLIELAEDIRNHRVHVESCDKLLGLMDKVLRQQISLAARRELADQRDARRTVSLQDVSEPVSGADEDPEQWALAKELLAVVRQHLTPEQTKICELRLESTPWRAIAPQLGRTENAVRGQWRRALDRIRRYLTLPY